MSDRNNKKIPLPAQTTIEELGASMSLTVKQHPRMRRWFWRVAILLTIGFIVEIYFHISETRFYQGMIPTKIETGQRYYIDGRTDALMGGCGIAVFTLSDKTIQDISNQGLSFFTEAKTGVGKRIIGDNVDSLYAPWKQTPMPSPALSDGLGGGFSPECSKGPYAKWGLEILQAFKQRGTFYTYNANGSGLYVIPAMKIVIFEYYR